MPLTYQTLASITVGAGGASSVSFTSIPQTFTDLIVKTSARNNGTNGTYFVNFNGTNTNTSALRFFVGSGTIASSAFSNSYFDYGAYSSTLANSFSNSELYIPNYASSNNKTLSGDTVISDNSISWSLFMTAGIKTETAAITSLTIAPVIDTLILQHSTFTLYGIKNA